MAKAPRFSKLEIIELTQRLARESDGRTPGVDALRNAGVTPYHWNLYWPKINDLQSECGLEPNSFDNRYTPDQILEHLANLTRRYGKFPTEAVLSRESRTTKSAPVPSAVRNSLGDKSQQLELLREWATTRDEWRDILTMLPEEVQTRKKTKPPGGRGTNDPTPLSDSFLPPVIASLTALGRCDPRLTLEAKRLKLDPDIEFERRVAIAFRMLGLTVEPLGQGRGRNPDGIAMCLPGHWAFVYDAKARGDGFRLTAAEDRKAEEYLKTADPRLRAAGVKSVYFVYISSEFSPADLAKANDLVGRTAAKSVTLLCTDALLALVTLRLREPERFDFDKLHRVFRLTDIVTAKSVER